MTTLLVIAKEPRPGRVKTRLTPPYTPGEAAELAEAALADTLRAVAAAPARRRVLVLDGEPGPWLPSGFDVVPQCPGGLDERLSDAFARCTGPALLIGMDTPQVTPALLDVDFTDCDACFGPAEDGGFWALGLAEPDPALLRGVPMSTPMTGAVQRERLVAAGLRVCDLPRLRDVDTAADAHAVAALAPHGRFAARLARCGAVTGVDTRRVPGGDARPVEGRDARPAEGQDARPGTGRDVPPGTGRDARPVTRPDARAVAGGDPPSAREGDCGLRFRTTERPGSSLHSEPADRPAGEPVSRPGTRR